MDKPFKPCDRNQLLLLPPSMLDWLPEDHLAYFIIDVVEQLDLTPIYSSYEGKRRGQPPYDPRMMTALLLYAYSLGVPSSRQIEKRTYEDVAFRVIAGNRHPDHDSICAFRKRHLTALAGLFLEVLRLCQKAGLVRLGHIALDGTKVKANASKHKAMSYGRMKKAKEELEREIKELLAQAEATDSKEDAIHGKGKKGWDLPSELKRRESRLQKIKEAMQALEEEAKAQAETAGKPKGPSPASDEPASPPDKAQRNFTDPDSRIMKMGSTKSFEQCYNGQLAVDEETQVIVGACLTQKANDVEQVEPLLDLIETNIGKIPFRLVVSADNGYFSETNVMLLDDACIEGYVATGKVKHGESLPAVRGRPPKGLTVRE